MKFRTKFICYSNGFLYGWTILARRAKTVVATGFNPWYKSILIYWYWQPRSGLNKNKLYYPSGGNG